MLSKAETSLKISEAHDSQTTLRDPSTHLGMTKRQRAFTIIELLVVIALIIVLAGLILSTVGYVQKKGARSRAEAEIAAMSAALENYKADNGIYPRGNASGSGTTPPYDTDKLDARAPVASAYQSACLFLYK